jgi:hypothetical protein
MCLKIAKNNFYEKCKKSKKLVVFFFFSSSSSSAAAAADTATLCGFSSSAPSSYRVFLSSTRYV